MDVKRNRYWAGHKVKLKRPTRSYLSRLIASYLLLTLVCVSVISVSAFRFTADKVRDLSIEGNKKMLSVLEGTVDNFLLSGMNMLAIQVAKQTEQLPEINYYRTHPIEGRVVELLQVDTYLAELLAQNSNLYSAAIYFETSDLVVSNFQICYGEENETISYYQQLLEERPRGGYVLDRDFPHTGECVVHLVRPLSQTEGVGGGAVVLTVRSAVLTEALGKQARQDFGAVCIVGNDGIVFGHTENGLIGRSLDSLGFLDKTGAKEVGDGYLIKKGAEGNMLVSYSTSDDTDWTYIALTPLAKVAESKTFVAWVFIVVSLLAALVGAVLSYLVAHRMYLPLENIAALCDSYAKKGVPERDECLRIRSAIEELSQTVSKQQERIEKNLPIVRNNLLHTLLSPGCNEEMVLEKFEMLGLTLQGNSFLVGVIQCGFYDRSDLFKVEGERLNLQSELEQCTAETDVFLCGEKEEYIAFLANSTDCAELKRRLERAITDWQERTIACLATAVIRETSGPLAGLAGVYNGLCTLLPYAYLYPGRATLPLTEIQERESNGALPDWTEVERFETAARIFNREEMRHEAELICETFRREALSLQSCKEVQRRMCAALAACAGRKNREPLPMREESEDTLDDWLCCFEEQIDEVCGRFSTRAGDRSRRLVKRAQEYIQIHFEDYDLGLAQVAGELQISTGHLSRIFKAETGVSFQDYLLLLFLLF